MVSTVARPAPGPLAFCGGFNHFLQLHDVNARQGNLYPRRTTTIIASVNKIRRLSSGTFMEFANADIMVL